MRLYIHPQASHLQHVEYEAGCIGPFWPTQKESSPSPLWNADVVEDFLDEHVGRRIVRLGLVGDGDTVAEDVHRHRLDVVWRDVVALLHERICAGSERQHDGGARRCAEADERLELRKAVVGGMACGVDKIDDVLLHFVFDDDRVERAADFLQLGGGEDGVDVKLRLSLSHSLEDDQFVLLFRVGDDQLEHEAVDLRFGQRIGSLLVDRVLRREDEKRLGQGVCVVADGDLALLHRLQKGALDFGWRAVDFVRENDICEYRPLLRAEIACLGIVNHCSDDIRWQQVWGELDAVEGRVERLGEAGDRQGLCQPWQSFDKHVVVAEKRQNQLADQVVLADDDSADFELDFFQCRGGFLKVNHGKRRDMVSVKKGDDYNNVKDMRGKAISFTSSLEWQNAQFVPKFRVFFESNSHVRQNQENASSNYLFFFGLELNEKMDIQLDKDFLAELHAEIDMNLINANVSYETRGRRLVLKTAMDCGSRVFQTQNLRFFGFLRSRLISFTIRH